jgi:hypothetical protein
VKCQKTFLFDQIAALKVFRKLIPVLAVAPPSTRLRKPLRTPNAQFYPASMKIIPSRPKNCLTTRTHLVYFAIIKKMEVPKMAISEGKKRFYITLTESKFVAYRQMLKTLGAPAGTDTLLIDEFVTGMVDYIGPAIDKALKAGKPLTFVDFFAMVGNMMKASQDEQQSLL